MVDRNSVLFITLDSCRYDTFVAADAPNLKSIAPLHKAMAPSHFTYGSHSAMFVGFTPSVPGCRRPILDNKFAKLFKIVGPASGKKGGEGYELSGRSVPEAFRSLGYRVVGTGAVGWFDPKTPTARHLIDDFSHFYYAENTWSLRRQVAWLEAHLASCGDEPMFMFLNVGETHVPYYFEGAPWSREQNVCAPYAQNNDAQLCRVRQKSCLEFVDRELESLVEAFADATILVCSDHGDCWGEDGLWEHGVSHEMTLTVPLLIRLRGTPVA